MVEYTKYIIVRLEMSKMQEEKCFPNYFSASAISEINKWGRDEAHLVYRIGKYGNNDETAFLNYYDEVVMGLKPCRNKEATLAKYKKSIDSLSISCYYDVNDIVEYYFSVTLKRNYPNKIVLKGKTIGEYGVSSITRKRKNSCDTSHIDWCLYEKSTPWEVFKEEEI